MNRLAIAGVSPSELRVTLDSGATRQTESIRLKTDELDRTELDALLASRQRQDLGLRCARYAQVIWQTLVAALPVLESTLESPLTVLVSGGPHVHALAWESLRTLPELDVRVVRVIDDGAKPAAPRRSRAELIWVGARKADDRVSRYQVFGPVGACLAQQSAWRPVFVDSASTCASIEALPTRVGRRSSTDSARVLHLDTHGVGLLASDITNSHLVGRDFAADLGGEYLTASTLQTLFAELDVDLFVANACFGGAQLSLGQWPFVARALKSGPTVAAAVGRGLYHADLAAIFHRNLYERLTLGKKIADAHAEALEATVAPMSSDDARAEACLQPALWLAGETYLDWAVEGPSLGAVSPVGGGASSAHYLKGCAVGGSIAEALAGFERAANRSNTAPILVLGPDSSISRSTAASLNEALAWVSGSKARAKSHSTTTITLEQLTIAEMRALLGVYWRAPKIVEDLLAWILSSDINEMQRVAQLHGGDPCKTLLSCLEMTGANLSPAVTADVIALAQPVIGTDDTVTLAGEWVPPGPQSLAHNQDGLVFGVMTRQGVVAVPTSLARDNARAQIPPGVLTNLRLGGAWQSQNEAKRVPQEWGTDTALATLSQLTFAIDARRVVGLMSPEALDALLHLVVRHDADVACNLVEALAEGLDDWRELDESTQAAYAQVASGLKELSHGPRVPPSPKQGGHRALSAEGSAGDTQDDGGRRARAYFLLDQNRHEEAREIATELFLAGRNGFRFRRAEDLHLLAVVEERSGGIGAAVRLLLMERALGSPYSERELHNRQHLLSLIAPTNSEELTLAVSVAFEGAELAAEIGDRQAQADCLEVALRRGLEASDEEWLSKAISVAERNDVALPPDSVQLARAVITMPSDPDAAVAHLSAISDHEGTAAAHACILLAGLLEDDAEEYLRRGARNPSGGYYRDLCLDVLLIALLSERRLGEVAPLIEDLLPDPARPVVCYAEAALTNSQDDLAATTSSLEMGLVGDGGSRLALAVTNGVPTQTVVQAAIVAVESLAAGLIEPGTPSVPPLAAVENLRRLGQGFDPDNAKWCVHKLLSVSESLWDAGSNRDLAIAAAARSQACQLMEEVGEPSFTTRAEELGWLGALERHRGRARESERAYEAAIEAGRNSLPPHRLGYLIGRLGNLHHELGNADVALRLQWRGVRVGRPDLALPDQPDDASIDLLTEYWCPPDATEAQWIRLLANLANCLRSDHPELAVQLTAAVRQWLKDGAELRADPHS